MTTGERRSNLRFHRTSSDLEQDNTFTTGHEVFHDQRLQHPNNVDLNALFDVAGRIEFHVIPFHVLFLSLRLLERDHVPCETLSSS